MTDAHRTKDEVVHLPNGGWRYSDEAYRRRWLKRVMAMTKIVNGCWLWQGWVHPRGYGQTWLRGHKNTQVHRAMYMMWHRVSLAFEQQVCHACDVRTCVNPDHLWLGTNKDNHRDKDAKRRNHFSNQTHCKRGHPFTPENTYMKKPYGSRGPARMCRTCQRERQRGYAHEQRT